MRAGASAGRCRSCSITSPADHPDAVASRRDLVAVNALMVHAGHHGRLMPAHARRRRGSLPTSARAMAASCFRWRAGMARHWPKVELTLVDRTALIEPRTPRRLRARSAGPWRWSGRRLRLVGEPPATEARRDRRQPVPPSFRGRRASPPAVRRRAARRVRRRRAAPRHCCAPGGAAAAGPRRRARHPPRRPCERSRRLLRKRAHGGLAGRSGRRPRGARLGPFSHLFAAAAGKKEVAREDARREVRRHRDRRRAGGQCDGHPAGARRAPRRAGRAARPSRAARFAASSCRRPISACSTRSVSAASGGPRPAPRSAASACSLASAWSTAAMPPSVSGGYGRALGRDRLDLLLSACARDAGATLFQPWQAVALGSAGGERTVRIASGTPRAAAVGATGRRRARFVGAGAAAHPPRPAAPRRATSSASRRISSTRACRST